MQDTHTTTSSFNEKKLITRLCNPMETLISQYGETTYKEWCEREVHRINAAKLGSVAVIELGGMVAVCRVGDDA